MGMVSNIGLMVRIMKVIGTIIKQKDKVLSGMLKVMYTEVNSKMIWLMDMESILISMGPNTKANSETMFKKAMVKKNGLMGPSTLEVTKYLQNTLSYIDKDRSAIWGWSYGGFLSLSIQIKV